MSKMARTNYWNPSVKYIRKNFAQNFMKPIRGRKVITHDYRSCISWGGCDCSTVTGTLSSCSSWGECD